MVGGEPGASDLVLAVRVTPRVELIRKIGQMICPNCYAVIALIHGNTANAVVCCISR